MYKTITFPIFFGTSGEACGIIVNTVSSSSTLGFTHRRSRLVKFK